MTEVTTFLTELGSHFGMITVGCVEAIAAVYLAGRMFKGKKKTKPEVRGSGKIFLDCMDDRKDEACIVVRRSDHMPVYASENLQKLAGFTLEQIQEDLMVLARIGKDEEECQRFQDRYHMWNREGILRQELCLKNDRWVQFAVADSEDGAYTYVYDFDTYTAYTWDQKDYDHYIRIAGVSFDGGENWITQFPVTIPESVEDGSMYIKAEWRYSEKDAWEEYVTPYFPYSTRLFLLPKKLEKENEEIDAETLLNQWNQFPGLGTLKLYNYTGSFFQNTDEPLTALLPGWTENGEKIPWSYELTAGRHILEPQDLVPLDPMYIVGIQVGWFGADDRIVLDILDPDTKLYYLQTLTGLNIDVTGENESKYIKNLNVPQYIQSVAMAESIETDVITIPDTVLYIHGKLGWQTEKTDQEAAEKLEGVEPGMYTRVCRLLEKSIFGGLDLEQYEERTIQSFLEKTGQTPKKMQFVRKKKSTVV